MSRMTAAQLRIQKMVNPFIHQENQEQQYLEEPQTNIKQLENSFKEQTEELYANIQLPENSSKEEIVSQHANTNQLDGMTEDSDASIQHREKLNTNTQPPENSSKEDIVSQHANTNQLDGTTEDSDASIPPTPEHSTQILFSDFSSGSSDIYIPNTDTEDSDDSDKSVVINKKKPGSKRIMIINESDSDTTSLDADGSVMNVAENKKRKSLKERRKDRLDRLLKRNAGCEYITKAGKVVRGRNMAPLVNCRMKCRERIPESIRQYVFNEYWNLGSYDDRAKYLERFIRIQKKVTSKVEPKKQRNYANKYTLVQFDNVYNICKNCLLKTLDESNRFLQTVNEKIQKFGHVTKSERGRAASYKKISEIRMKAVEQHILKFPAYESHYSRKKTSKKYLSADLSVEKMYSFYKSDTENPVSISVYRKVFKDMNLSFKKPSVDTCNKCNLLQSKLKYATSVEDTETVQIEIKKHQEDYEGAYEEKRKDKEKARSNSGETCVIAFDLQQCLPTPMLTTSTAFYKRQLWVFNLTIHDFKTNHAYCYMWPESSGGRGSNQIASCLHDFITARLPLLHPDAKHLILYSDSCGGQNKNSIVTTMLLLAIQNSVQLTTIEHKFLVPGHTHMEVDSDHALIERARKRTSLNIHHPRDWYQLVRTASNRENKFSVIEMTENEFYDFAAFSKLQFINKKVNCNGQKFVWSDVRVIRYTKGQYPGFEYKENYIIDDFISMTYAKRNKNYNTFTITSVNKCYTGPIPISVQKKRVLISLLPYIDPCVHDFYHNLITHDSPDIDPDLVDSEE